MIKKYDKSQRVAFSQEEVTGMELLRIKDKAVKA